MKYLLAAGALWLVLLAAAPARALGLSFSLGSGVITEGPDAKLAYELSPFLDLTRLRIELPIEHRLHPASAWAIRPGIKVFIPVTRFYARGGLGWGELGAESANSLSLILGGGWDLPLLDAVGVFVEATAEPRLYPWGSAEFMGRVGVTLAL